MVGGDAAGMSAASQARRLRPDLVEARGGLTDADRVLLEKHGLMP